MKAARRMRKLRALVEVYRAARCLDAHTSEYLRLKRGGLPSLARIAQKRTVAASRRLRAAIAAAGDCLRS